MTAKRARELTSDDGGIRMKNGAMASEEAADEGAAEDAEAEAEEVGPALFCDASVGSTLACDRCDDKVSPLPQ